MALYFNPISLHKYLYANANPIAYTDPTGNFSILGLELGQAIDKILDSAAQLNYVKIFNTINDALSAYDFVRTVYDTIVNAESIEEVAFSIAIGVVTSVAINKCTLIENPIVKKIISGVLATVGIGGEAKGIYEAAENGDYDLVITRSLQLAMTFVGALFFNCFTGETFVATVDGQKRIDEIEVGDLVWSANVETGEVELKTVTEVFVKEDNVLVHLTINGSTINTTALHPFYVVDRGWIEAVEIEVGDKVLLQDGTTVTVDDKTTEQFETPVKVYNFTVNEFHTYFVGGDRVLVHNADVGSYTIEFESGKQYHGKGTKNRMEQSAKYRSNQNADPVVKKEWTQSVDDVQAFIDEYFKIMHDGGPNNTMNYNKIQSPGRKLYEKVLNDLFG